MSAVSCTTNINSWRRSEDEIAASFLKIAPLSTTFEEVESLLRSKGFKPKLSPNVGFYRQQRGLSDVIGAKSIRVFLGEYRNSVFATTSVVAFFGFDAQGKLTDIWVKKEVDSL